MNIKDFFEKASHYTSKAYLKTLFNKAREYTLDIVAAIRHKDAMTPQQRKLDEFKLGGGALITAVGLAELNPFAAAGGAIPAWEAAREMEHAGHNWRVKHPGMSAF